MASSSQFSASSVRLLLRVLARNQTREDLFNRIKLHGVNKRVCADVEEWHECQNRDNAFDVCDHVEVDQHEIDVEWQPSDDIERTDKGHRLNQADLNMTWMGLDGTWPGCTVTGHHTGLTTHYNQNAPVAEGEDENHDQKVSRNSFRPTSVLLGMLPSWKPVRFGLRPPRLFPPRLARVSGRATERTSTTR